MISSKRIIYKSQVIVSFFPNYYDQSKMQYSKYICSFSIQVKNHGLKRCWRGSPGQKAHMKCPEALVRGLHHEAYASRLTRHKPRHIVLLEFHQQFSLLVLLPCFLLLLQHLLLCFFLLLQRLLLHYCFFYNVIFLHISVFFFYFYKVVFFCTFFCLFL